MTRANGHDLQAQLAQLQALYEQGLLSEANYRAALLGMGLDPERVGGTIYQVHIERGEGTAIGDGAHVEANGRGDGECASLRCAYLSRLVRQTRGLPLGGIDPEAAREAKSHELQLAAVYTALLTRSVEMEKEMRAHLDRPDQARRSLSALEMLNREPHLVLLGGPGSGKSTFCNFVALCLAGEGLGDAGANLAALTAPLPAQRDKEDEQPESQPWDHGALLPVRIVLRDLAARGLPEPGERVNGDTLWAFIVNELGDTLAEFAPYLKQELRDRGGLILLDGLDEVPDAHRRREQVKAVVQGLAGDFPHCRFLVTSRTYAYQRQAWKLEGFTEAVLSAFGPAQVSHFVDRWYDHIRVVKGMNADDAQGQAVLLKTAIERSERLAELATRPLLLTLMASLHAWRGGSLPEKREELYADAVDLLLDQWERPKVVRDAQGTPVVRQPSLAEWLKVDRTVVRAELERLAFEAHRDQPDLVGTADIVQEKLVGGLMTVSRNPEINPVRLVEYVRDRAGLLAARGEGVYAFPHRTFQEYLAACHLTDYGFPDQVADLLRAAPQRWREATLLAGAKAARGTSAAAWSLAAALCYRDPPEEGCDAVDDADCWGALLAAQVLLENEGALLGRVSERNAPRYERIRHWLKAIVVRGWLPPVDRKLAGEALAVFGDDRDFEALVAIPGGAFVLGEDGDGRASPQHEVTLAAFRIGRYPVTNGQYRRFVEATGRAWRSPDAGRPEKANCPAAYMSWYDARAYCDWLTGVWRAAGRIGADEIVRLPSEAEWERAARGTDGRTYPWGTAWETDRANTRELELGETCAVGMFAQGASPDGGLDMAGQVWEWMRSLWGRDYGRPEFKYPYDPTDGREDPEAGDEVARVLRGGSFDGDRVDARCASRGRSSPNYEWH